MGAIDLTCFGIGKKNTPPTIDDVKVLNNTDFFPEQLDYSMCVQHYKNIMGVQPQDEFEKSLSSIKSKKEKEERRDERSKRKKPEHLLLLIM